MKRTSIYILAIIFTIAFAITQSNFEVEHFSNNNLDNLNYIEEEYKEIDITYPLEIKNYQNDNNKLEYIYKLKITGISGAYKYKYKDKESYMVFTANGESQITLESNESITIYDLPENAEYEIEQITNVSDTYKTQIDGEYKTKITGTITQNTSIVEFDNQALKENIKPNHKVENPYTKDSYYFIILIACFALIIVSISKKYKMKRFD